MSLKDEAIQLAKRAKAAARKLAPISSAEKNRALHLMADRLEARGEFLLAENKKDWAAAKAAGSSSAWRRRSDANHSDTMRADTKRAGRPPGRGSWTSSPTASVRSPMSCGARTRSV